MWRSYTWLGMAARRSALLWLDLEAGLRQQQCFDIGFCDDLGDVMEVGQTTE